MNKYLFYLLILFTQIACQKETDFEFEEKDVFTELQATIDQKVLNHLFSVPSFDWNLQDDELICEALPLTDNTLVVGLTTVSNISNFDTYLSNKSADIEVLSKDEVLGIYYLKLSSCDNISTLRELDLVEFVELNYFMSDLTQILNAAPSEIPLEAEIPDYGTKNPANYIPSDTQMYLEYLETFDGGMAEHAYKQNIDKVYHEMGYYGSKEIGVAVLDNGVREEAISYFYKGTGGFDALGFYKWNWGDEAATDDGIYPQPYDVLSLWQFITPSFNHGTSRCESIYALSPQTPLKSIRSSPIYLMLSPSQLLSTTDAIKAMADDDDVQIISMAMGGIFVSNQMIAAIRYFNSKGKLMICAGGSSIPGLREALGIIFPGNLPETISITGIKDLEETNGRWVLGDNAHGGKENDFVIEPAESSSEGVSSFSGMLATIWSINPDLSPEELIDMAIHQSNFYKEQGAKDELFGWGKVDMHAWALEVEASL